mgnify:CR=1 FL=1
MFRVALRKESVDRNLMSVVFLLLAVGSLSARRAWIEIMINQKKINPASLSARRAWIEIGLLWPSRVRQNGRSPQGERG